MHKELWATVFCRWLKATPGPGAWVPELRADGALDSAGPRLVLCTLGRALLDAVTCPCSSLCLTPLRGCGSGALSPRDCGSPSLGTQGGSPPAGVVSELVLEEQPGRWGGEGVSAQRDRHCQEGLQGRGAPMRPALSREPPGRAPFRTPQLPSTGVITGDPSPLPAGHPCPSLPRLLSSPEDACFYRPTSWPRHLPEPRTPGLRGVCVMPH